MINLLYIILSVVLFVQPVFSGVISNTGNSIAKSSLGKAVDINKADKWLWVILDGFQHGVDGYFDSN